MQHFSPDSRFSALRRVVALGLVAGLAACGGGGGGTSGGEAPPTAQGRWTSGATGTDFTALVVPDSSIVSGYQAWVVSNDGSTLAKLRITSANAATGTRFTLGTPGSSTPVAGTASVTGSADNPGLSLPGLGVNNLSMTRTHALTGTTTIAPFAGAWTATVSGGSKEVTLTINAVNGNVTGLSTTGCTYTGNFTPRSDSPVVNANFTESCPVPGDLPTQIDFSGIARLNEAQSQLTVVAVSSGDDVPWLVLMTRPAIPG